MLLKILVVLLAIFAVAFVFRAWGRRDGAVERRAPPPPRRKARAPGRRNPALHGLRRLRADRHEGCLCPRRLPVRLIPAFLRPDPLRPDPLFPGPLHPGGRSCGNAVSRGWRPGPGRLPAPPPGRHRARPAGRRWGRPGNRTTRPARSACWRCRAGRPAPRVPSSRVPKPEGLSCAGSGRAGQRSCQSRAKRCGSPAAPSGRSRQVTETVPSSPARAPCFTALVASSWIARPSCCAASGRTMTDGPSSSMRPGKVSSE